ncbi:hypothetical protein CWI37_0373p0020 [Hamiltosporidium tvaerminnensis]|uniref:Actin-like protein n=2 Tax=Hamiltosporidium tvaerminnensis TaxID=1176355 RepID=A0A4Q9L7W1_9MICR|nr:hypothetical protein CWI37_0373p0020 [Hamiltosporidium tvaerminnensis]
MENIGIDIGTFKTVISSSHEKGRIIYDELSKRSFPTAIQLTSPKRRFGNLVIQSRIKINKLFTTDLTDQHNLTHTNMFLQYCRRLIAHTTPTTNITLSIPYTFTDIHKRTILSLFSHPTSTVTLIQDTTATALASLLKIEKKSKFLNIIDLGYSKTTSSSFTLTSSLTPIYLSGIPIGSKDIDKATLSYLSIKYPSIINHTHRIDIDYMKTLLNSTPTVQMCIELPETSQNIEISQQEYEEANKEVLLNLEEFFFNYQQHIIKTSNSLEDDEDIEGGVNNNGSKLEGVNNNGSKQQGVNDTTNEQQGVNNSTNEQDPVNNTTNEQDPLINNNNPSIIVVGGNSNNYLIRKILTKYFKVSFNLNADESVSNGSAFSTFFYSPFSLSKVTYKDILYNTIFIDNQVLFKSGTLIPSPPLKVTYKKKNNFSVFLKDNNDKIGSVSVFLKEDKTVEVSLFIGLDRNGIVRVEKVEINNKEIDESQGSVCGGENVENVEDNSNIKDTTTKDNTNDKDDGSIINSYKFEISGLNQDYIKIALEEELKCRKKEEEYEIIGNMRNGLEMGIKKLLQRIEVLGVEGEGRGMVGVVEEIKEDLGFMELSGSVEEENKLNEEIRIKLKNVDNLLRGIEEEKYKKINEILMEAEGVVREAESVKGDVGLGLVLYKLKGGCFRMRKVLSEFENIDVLFGETVDCRIEKEVREMIGKVRSEIIRRKEEIERERIEREKEEREKKEKKDSESVKNAERKEEKSDKQKMEEEGRKSGERKEEKGDKQKMEEEGRKDGERKEEKGDKQNIEEEEKDQPTTEVENMEGEADCVIVEEVIEEVTVEEQGVNDNKEGIENKTFNDNNFIKEDQRKDKKVKEGEE